jgi:transcriptional regulator with XRE-family HTH domain
MEVFRLKQVMKEKGVSREELASRVGTTKTTISNICSDNDYLPTIKLLLQIAEALNCDIRELFVPTRGEVYKAEVDEAKIYLKKAISILEGEQVH